MSDFGIGNVAGKIAGKLANAANSSRKLMCLGKCDKITEHISISYADHMISMDCRDDDTGAHVYIIDGFFGTVGDLLPIFPLLLGNSYACTCCNKIRSHGGAFSDIDNRGKVNLYLKKK